MSAPEDHAFARFARTGDPAALGEVYDRVAVELLGVAMHLCRDPAAAEDVLQATFVTAIERSSSFVPGRRVMPWLVGVLGNHAREARRKARGAGDASPDAEPTAASPEAAAEHGELLDRLEATLASVPEAFRPVLILRLRHGLSATEIAHALQRPPGTVRSQLARGLELVRRSLPAGLAGMAALALAPPVRGLAAVRAAVIAHPSLAAGGLTLSSVVGALLVKKTLVAVAVGLALLSAWWSWTRPPARPLEAAEPLAPVAGLEPLDSLEPSPHALPAEPGREVAAAGPEPIPQAPSAAPESGSVALLARHVDGRPATDALALLSLDGADLLHRPALRAWTDEEGRARFEDVTPGFHQARLLLGTSESVHVVAGETASVSLRLHDGYTVTVEVLDELDRPLPDAEVWLSERSQPDLGHFVGRTDADGRLTIEELDDYHYVGARASGRAMSAVQNLRGAPGGHYSVRLRLIEAGVRVAGVVVGPHGEAVPRAVVLVGADQDPVALRLENGFAMPGPPPLSTSTDAAGAFDLEGIAPGLQPVRVQAEGHAAFASEVQCGAQGVQGLRLCLEPEARVEGRVLDAGGSPVAGTQITTLDRAGAAGSTTFSDVRGEFALKGLAGGTVTLEASHELHGRDERALTVIEGQATRWDPVLQAVPRIFGRIVDQEGRPLAHWPITAMDDALGRAGAQTTTSDHLGRFSISGLEDRAYSLWINEPRSWREFPRHVEAGVRPSAVEVRIQLEDTGAVRGGLVGEVLAPDGAAVIDAQVTLWHAEQRMWRSFPLDPESGRFEIPGVPPGTVEVEVRSSTHPWARLGEHAIEAGRTTDLGTLRLAAGASVHGTISGGRPESLESLEFVIGAQDGAQGGTVVRDGREFRTSVLAEGDYTLVVRADWVESQELPLHVTAGAALRMDIALRPAPLRRIELAFEPGVEPVRVLWVSVSDAAGRRVWLAPALTPDADGVFHARVSAPAGTYELVAGAHRGERARVPITIEGSSAELPPLKIRLASHL